MLVVQRFLHAIDIFPGVITSRLNYNGKTTAKSSLGGCGTILYLFAIIGLTVYYAIPVFTHQKPHTGSFYWKQPQHGHTTTDSQLLLNATPQPQRLATQVLEEQVTSYVKLKEKVKHDARGFSARELRLLQRFIWLLQRLVLLLQRFVLLRLEC